MIVVATVTICFFVITDAIIYEGTFFDHSACAFLHDVERLIDTYLSHDGHQMSNNDDRVVNFVSPEELKVSLFIKIIILSVMGKNHI